MSGDTGIRGALASHLEAYSQLLGVASRQWSTRLVRSVAAYAIAAFLALVMMLVVVFVAILAAWPTQYRWWVVGGILFLFAVGITWGLLAAKGAMRANAVAPWEVLAEELAADLRGPEAPREERITDE